MHIVYTIAYILLLVGIFMALEITPEEFVNVLLELLRPSSKIRYRVEDAQEGRGKKGLYSALLDMKLALEGTGKGAMFPLMIFAAVLAFAGGFFLSVLVNNMWLAPTLGICFASIPISYITRTVNYHARSIKNELETALSIISNSYLRNNNIVSAVGENVDHIKPPLRKIFENFVLDARVSSSIKSALEKLKGKVNDQIFYEWVTALIQCQDDRNMKDNLLPIVSKLTDIRLVNNQINNTVMTAKIEYFTMLGMLIGSVPLLYLINVEWFDILMYTDIGKAAQGIIGLICVITWFMMKHYTRPVEYEK